MADKVKALVWSEFTEPKDVYPVGIHGEIAKHLNAQSDVEAKTAQIEDPQQGVSEESLAWADVLLWWGHKRHRDITDENLARIVKHVKERGMGYFAIHSAHYSRGLIALLETGCGLGGVGNGGAETVSVVMPDHPIAEGVTDFVVPQTEYFTEPFDVPEPEAVVLRSTFETDDKLWFRSGSCWTVEEGRVFYFRPGHETFPIMRQPEVLKVVYNGTLWAAKRT
ncbi:trehalose utilization protein ThuA [Candidatus Poribacteria bacterium]|nr:trehalose utilization protein ThuA [Candidatus Poribacteria bacterium]